MAGRFFSLSGFPRMNGVDIADSTEDIVASSVPRHKEILYAVRQPAPERPISILYLAPCLSPPNVLKCRK